MNKRIDELAYQSGITQHSYSNPKHSNLDGFIVSQEKLEKFAELIVQECCKISDEVERADLSVLVSKFIKAHFGIE